MEEEGINTKMENDSTHIFSSSAGHGTIEGKIILLVEESQSITIKTTDGRVLTAKLSDFTSADKDYVYEWQKSSTKRREKKEEEEGAKGCYFFVKFALFIWAVSLSVTYVCIIDSQDDRELLPFIIIASLIFGGYLLTKKFLKSKEK